jgi:hypothetical protein
MFKEAMDFFTKEMSKVIPGMLGEAIPELQEVLQPAAFGFTVGRVPRLILIILLLLACLLVPGHGMSESMLGMLVRLRWHGMGRSCMPALV